MNIQNLIISEQSNRLNKVAKILLRWGISEKEVSKLTGYHIPGSDYDDEYSN